MFTNRRYATQIEKQIRLKTYPLGIKMLRSEEDIPQGFMRPRRDTGHCLSTCQAFALSRMSGAKIAMLKEDMWCYLPVIGYGIAPPPREFLDGRNRYPLGDDATPLSAAFWASKQFPRFKTGKYIGVASAPLANANFDPDLVIIYSNSLQLTILLHGIAYNNGRDIPTTLSRTAACVYSVVCPLREHRCWVSIPCMGDRRRAMAGDDEMIFSLPANQIEDLVIGLRRTERRVPFEPALMPEYPLLPAYSDMAKSLGMTTGNGTET
jgi:uncharacterized protein (DUF169 family)